MEIRQSKDGLKTFRETVHLNGKRLRSPSLKRKSDATQWKAKTMVDREKIKLHGDDFKSMQEISILDFSTKWLEERIKNHRSQSTYTDYVNTISKKIIPIVGNKALNKVTKADGYKLIKALQEMKHNNRGVNKILILFKQVMNEAEKDGYILKRL